MYSFSNPQENPTKIHNITDYQSRESETSFTVDCRPNIVVEAAMYLIGTDFAFQSRYVFNLGKHVTFR